MLAGGGGGSTPRTTKVALPDLRTPAGAPRLPDSHLAAEWPSHCPQALLLQVRYRVFTQSREDFENLCIALTAPSTGEYVLHILKTFPGWL